MLGALHAVAEQAGDLAVVLLLRERAKGEPGEVVGAPLLRVLTVPSTCCSSAPAPGRTPTCAARKRHVIIWPRINVVVSCALNIKWHCIAHLKSVSDRPCAIGDDRRDGHRISTIPLRQIISGVIKIIRDALVGARLVNVNGFIISRKFCFF